MTLGASQVLLLEQGYFLHFGLCFRSCLSASSPNFFSPLVLRSGHDQIHDFKVHSSTLTEIVTHEVHLFNYGIQKVNITEKEGLQFARVHFMNELDMVWSSNLGEGR